MPSAVDLPARLGPAIWMDASKTAGEEGAIVSGGIDRAGAAYSSTAGPTKHLGVLNNRPVLRFNGTNQYIDYSSLSRLDNVDTVSWFVLWSTVVDYNQAPIETYCDAGVGWGIWAYNRHIRSWARETGGGRFLASTPLAYGWQLTSGVWRANDTLDSRSGELVTTLTGVDGTIDKHDLTRIGTRYGSTHWLEADVAEVVVIPTELNDAEWKAIRKYFYDKYALNDTGIGYSPLSASVLYFEYETEDWNGRPMLLDNGTHWIMVYRQAESHTGALSDVLHIRFSDDEGATWTDDDKTLADANVTGFPISGHSNGASGGQIAKAPNGDLILMVREDSPSRGGTYLWKSTDNGATWTDEGQINADDELLAGGQIVVVGSDMYASFWVDPSADGAEPYRAELYKSDDNGASWSSVATIMDSDSCDEAALIHLGGTTLLSIIRDTSKNVTYQAYSTDMGATWSAAADISAQVGVVQRPRLQDIEGRLFLYGRQYTDSFQRSCVYWSDDDGVSWLGPFYPDGQSYKDTGYCDMLKRSNGSLYMVSYAGNFYATALVEYVFQ